MYCWILPGSSLPLALSFASPSDLSSSPRVLLQHLKLFLEFFGDLSISVSLKQGCLQRRNPFVNKYFVQRQSSVQSQPAGQPGLG